MQLPQEQKIAGVLAPLFALRRDDDLGIGDVAALRQFIDWSKENGFKLVQLLPINETGGDNSPYNAISAMAIEPTTLHLASGSPEDLSSEDFEALTSAAHVERLRQGPAKHARVKKLKRRLLEKAFETFLAGASEERRAAFVNFQNAERDWLDLTLSSASSWKRTEEAKPGINGRPNSGPWRMRNNGGRIYGRSTRPIGKPPPFFRLCPVDRATTMGSGQEIRGRTGRRVDGRYPIRN